MIITQVIAILLVIQRRLLRFKRAIPRFREESRGQDMDVSIPQENDR